MDLPLRGAVDEAVSREPAGLEGSPPSESNGGGWGCSVGTLGIHHGKEGDQTTRPGRRRVRGATVEKSGLGTFPGQRRHIEDSR